MRIIPVKSTNRLENTNSLVYHIVTPVRKVSKNGFSATGEIKSRKSGCHVQYESSLERDLVEMLEFDPNVEHFLEQPFEIPYRDKESIDRIYVPDFLVVYKKNLSPARWFPPVIVEVKYMADIKNDFDELKFKFRAAHRFAKKKGWRFRVMTERHIRTEYLENAKFLSKFKYQQVDPGLCSNVLDALDLLQDGTPMEIIATGSSNTTRRAEMLFTLWHLVANGEVGCDLNDRLSMDTILWYKRPSMFHFKKPQYDQVSPSTTGDQS